MPRVSKQETGVGFTLLAIFVLLLLVFGRAGQSIYTNSDRIYMIDEDSHVNPEKSCQSCPLIDSGGEPVHGIDNEHGNRRVENQIENHA